MKRGQIPSQMFTYILTMLIIGMTLFLGVKWIGALLESEEEITEAQLKTDIENTFKKSRSYGDWSVEVFSIPSRVEKVCFFDKDADDINNEPVCVSNNNNFDPYLCDSWLQDNNIAFAPGGSISTNVELTDIKVDDGYLCFNNTNGKIHVKLTGLGNKVKVSRS